MPDSTPRGTQGDTLDQWRRQQKKDLADRQKREAQTSKRNKKNHGRGALPSWIAEFLLLTVFAGVGFAGIALGDQMRSIYGRVDRFLLGLFPSKK